MNPCFTAVCAFAMALGCGLTACASAGAPPAAAPASLTAAELSSAAPASSTEPTPSRDEATAGPVAPGLAGKLVCRTTNCVDGTTELYLDWNGKVASGVLRRTAPSGMVYEQPVRAERYQGTIVVDEPEGADLASHAAMVVEQHGKLHMRVGAPGQAVTACE